ncbi:MAG TPA: ferredoxin family protein [Armatimonadota bacterium]|nr:ferredoxin family protein [Armatimonadota bacterium]
MPYIKINRETCKACTLCIEFCPRDCIVLDEEMNSRGHHPAKFIGTDRCTGCRMCATMCPDVCIEVYREEKSPA